MAASEPRGPGISSAIQTASFPGRLPISTATRSGATTIFRTVFLFFLSFCFVCYTHTHNASWANAIRLESCLGRVPCYTTGGCDWETLKGVLGLFVCNLSEMGVMGNRHIASRSVAKCFLISYCCCDVVCVHSLNCSIGSALIQAIQ